MYETYYELSKTPFRLNSDPDFFFTSSIHSRAMDYLLYGVSQEEGFIVITGQPGLGKTMLVKTLCEELYDKEIIVSELVTTQVSRNDIIRLVVSGFGLSHHGLSKAALLNVLENYLLSKIRRGKRVLLIVDEAHHLSAQSIEELRLLMNLEDQGRQLLQCFLLGQEQLKSTLQIPELEQVRQRVIATYHLEPMDAEETRQYIEFRLKKAGWSDRPQFNDDAFTKIHQFTSGVPRKINLLCHRILAYGYLEELNVLSAGVIETVGKELDEEVIAEKSTDKLTNSNIINFDRTLETRIRRLESKVDLLKERLRKERRLLRKALVMHTENNTEEKAEQSGKTIDQSGKSSDD
ncbi:MAG: XrtA-associated ATPase [Gammaproteobacteria bacterium]|nr:XrtA-associated ATPase [Gammaproteobacteria bacterium]